MCLDNGGHFSDVINAQRYLKKLGYDENYEKAYREAYCIVKKTFRCIVEKKMSRDQIETEYKYEEAPK